MTAKFPQYPSFNNGGASYSSFNNAFPQFPNMPTYKNAKAKFPQYPQYKGFPQFPQYPSAYDYQVMRKKRAREQATGFNNPFTDPYAINSLSDVIFNGVAKDARYGKVDTGNVIGDVFGWLGQTTHALFDHANDNFVQPVMSGDFERAFYNSINSLSEDFDMFSNPIKGMIIETGVGSDAAIAGGIGAAIGGGTALGVILLASGPVGWLSGAALVLGGMLTGAGVAATGTALATDPEKAMLGFQRGLGMTDEGKYNYKIETGMGFVGDLVANMALDPGTWVTFGMGATSRLASESLKGALRTGAARTSKHITFSEIWNASDSLMDYAYAGLRGVHNMERAIAKVSFGANPLGVMLKAGKYVSKTTLNMYSEFRAALDPPTSMDILKPLASDGAIDIYEDLAGKARSGGRILNPMEADNVVGLQQALHNDVRLSERFMEKLRKVSPGMADVELASDFTPLRNFATDRMEFYYKNLADASNESIMAHVIGDLKTLIVEGGFAGYEVLDSGDFSTLIGNLYRLGDNGISEFAGELTTSVLSGLDLAQQMKIDAKTFSRVLTGKMAEGGDIKIAVLQQAEDTLKELMGVSNPDMQLGQLLHLMGGGNHNIAAYYKPLFDEFEYVLTSAGITADDLASFVRRGAQDMDALNAMMNTATSFEGLGRPNVLSGDYLEFVPTDIAGPLARVSSEIGEYSIAKDIAGRMGKAGTLKTVDQAYTGIVHEEMFRLGKSGYSNFEDIQQSLNMLMDFELDMIAYQPQFSSSRKTLENLARSIQSLTSVAVSHNTYKDLIKKLSDSAKAAGIIKKDIFVKGSDPKTSLDILQRRILKQSQYVRSPQMLSDLEAARIELMRMDTANDVYTSVSEAMSSLDAVETSYAAQLVTTGVTVGEYKDIMGRVNTALRTIRGIVKVEKPEELLSSWKRNKRFVTPQVSKTSQNLQLTGAALKGHRKLIKQFDDPDSYMNALNKSIRQLDTVETGFGQMQDAWLEVSNRMYGVNFYADLTRTLNDVVRNNGLSSSVYMSTLDFLSTYDDVNEAVSPKILLEGLSDTSSDIYKTFDYKLRSLEGLDTAMLSKLRDLMMSYLYNLDKVGIPSPVYLPGSHFNTSVNQLNLLLPRFLKGVKDMSHELSNFSELKSLSQDVYATVLDLDANNNVMADMLVDLTKEGRTKGFIQDLNRTSATYGYKRLGNRKSYANSIVRGIKDAKRAGFEESGHVQFATARDRMTERAVERLKFTMEELSFSDLDNLGSNLPAQHLDALLHRLHVEGDAQIQDLSKYDGGMAKEYLYGLQNSNMEAVKSLSYFTQTINRHVVDDAFFNKESHSLFEQNFSDTLKAMSAPELASYMKYHTPNDWLVIERQVSPAPFPDLLIDGLAPYGLTVQATDQYWVILKAADTDLYTNLSQDMQKFSYSRGLDAKSVNISASNRLMDEVTSTLGITMNLDSTNYMPIRFDLESTISTLASNEELMTVLGQERIDEFVKKLPRSRGYDRTFFGTREFIQQFVGMSDTGISYLPAAPIRNHFNAGLTSAYQQNDAVRYRSLLLNEEFQVSNILKTDDPKVILEYYKANPDMRAGYLSAKGKVASFAVTDMFSAKRALKLNAIVTDNASISRMGSILSPTKVRDLPGGKFLEWYQRNITPFFTSQIFTIGAAIRNFIDAVGIKNNMVNSLASDPKFLYQSLKELELVAEMDKELLGDFNHSNIDEFLKKKFGDDADTITYYTHLVNDIIAFDNTSASGGILEAQMNKRFADARRSGAMKDQSIVQKVMYGNPWVTFQMNLFGSVENMARYSLYRAERVVGTPTPTALNKVIEAHFDYGNRGPIETYANILFPFISFAPRNLLWWADHAFDNMRFLTAMVVYTQESYLEDDRRAKSLLEGRSDYLNSQFHSGNPLEQMGQYSTLLKLNPSLFDAFNFIPELISDPLQRLSPPIKDAIRVANGEITSWDELNYPMKSAINRMAKNINTNIPNAISGLQGNDEDWRMIPGVLSTLFNVTKFEQKDYKKWAKLNFKVPYTPGVNPTRYRRVYPKNKRVDYGADAYRVKGGQALSTGHVTKGGNFRASSGIGYGNPMLNRNYTTDMHIRFGRKGPWLANAPVGVRLSNPNKGRTMYEKMYSKSGKSRIMNRTRLMNDPRGLMFALQDMKYNVF